MTPEELGRMTLADFEAASERWRKAGDALREVRMLMGGPVQVVPASRVTDLSTTGGVMTVAPVSTPHPGLDAGEVAERNRLLQQMRMNTAQTVVDEGALSE